MPHLAHGDEHPERLTVAGQPFVPPAVFGRWPVLAPVPHQGRKPSALKLALGKTRLLTQVMVPRLLGLPPCPTVGRGINAAAG
jgi:hypothetical protein